LFDEGVAGAVAVPMSFGASLSVTLPPSGKIEKQGFVVVQVPPVVTTVRTSELRTVESWLLDDPPRFEVRVSITRNTGELPVLTALPQDTAARSAAVVRMRVTMRIPVICSC
jgi:hypothetical protein